MVVAFRRHTLLPLDDCLCAPQPSIPHLTRSALHRCLQRHGISRLPDVQSDKPKRQTRLGALGPYPRPAPPELGQLRQASHVREVERVGSAGWPTPGRATNAPNGIQVVRTRKFKATSDSDHTFHIAPNLLQQDFTASGPNQKWAGDITYVWTREGWVCLALIIDLFSRRVVGWAISNRMKQDLALRTLNRAAAWLHPPNRSRVAILRSRRPEASAQTRVSGVHEWEGQLLRQFCRRELLQVAEGRNGLAPQLADPPRGRRRPLRIDQRLLQSAQKTLSSRLEIIRGFGKQGRLT